MNSGVKFCVSLPKPLPAVDFIRHLFDISLKNEMCSI